MTDAAPAPVAEEAPPSAPRRRMPGRGTIVAGAVVLALAVGAVVAIPLGGWDTVELESAAIPELGVGELYEGRHYSVRLEEAWVGDVVPDEYDEPEEGMTFVIVRAVVRNEWREPDGDASRLLTFEALDLLPKLDRDATVRIASDGVYAPPLSPGVATEVLLRWEVPAGSVSPGDPIAFGVIDGRPERAILYSGTAWRDEQVVVEATLVPRPSSELEYSWDG